MRIADLLATRRANKRMMKLSLKLKKRPWDKDLKAELWLRCDEFQDHLMVGFGSSRTFQTDTDFADAGALKNMIEQELGASELADRIQHLDPWRAQALRERR